MATGPAKKLAPIFLISLLQALAAALRSPQSLLFPRLTSPSSPSLSSQQRGSSPQIIAGAPSGPAPTAPALSCAEGSRTGHHTQSIHHQKKKKGICFEDSHQLPTSRPPPSPMDLSGKRQGTRRPVYSLLTPVPLEELVLQWGSVLQEN